MAARDRPEPEHQQRGATRRAERGDRRREPPAEPALDHERARAADEPRGNLLQRRDEGEVWVGHAGVNGETGEAVGEDEGGEREGPHEQRPQPGRARVDDEDPPVLHEQE